MNEKRQGSRSLHTLLEGMLFLALSIALGWHALHSHYGGARIGWELSPYLFPLLIAVLLLLLSLVLVAEGLRGEGVGKPDKARWGVMLVTVAAAVAYFLLMPALGFVLSTTLFLLGMFLFLGERRPLVLILVPLLFASAIYLSFGKLLYVMLPRSQVDFIRMGLDLLM